MKNRTLINTVYFTFIVSCNFYFSEFIHIKKEKKKEKDKQKIRMDQQDYISGLQSISIDSQHPDRQLLTRDILTTQKLDNS